MSSHGHGLDLIMRNVDGSRVRRAMDPQQLRPHLDTQFRIEVGKGFVEQQDAWLRCDHAGDRHALLLTAGDLVWIAICKLADPEQVEHLADTLAALVPVKSGHLQRPVDVPCDSHMRPERI